MKKNKVGRPSKTDKAVLTAAYLYKKERIEIKKRYGNLTKACREILLK